jgi:MOSC domain-containing protein YiiM
MHETGSEIGYIELLQVQLGRLKQGEKPDLSYDPAPLRTVPALRLTPKGVVGLVGDKELLDVHHADHVYSKNRSSSGISLNFTSHYEKMRNHFSDHLAPGCAGENILVMTDQVLSIDDISSGLVIQAKTGDLVRLEQTRVATPCASFSKYALGHGLEPASDTLKQTLQFLDGGTRGFYCECAGDPVVVRPGDRVFLTSD